MSRQGPVTQVAATPCSTQLQPAKFIPQIKVSCHHFDGQIISVECEPLQREHDGSAAQGKRRSGSVWGGYRSDPCVSAGCQYPPCLHQFFQLAWNLRAKCEAWKAPIREADKLVGERTLSKKSDAMEAGDAIASSEAKRRALLVFRGA